MKTITKTISLSLALLLNGCLSPDETQDAVVVETPTNQSPVQIPVSIMNGYVANALVWIDFRDNGAIDGSEPFAFSDGQGYVSFNPNTGVNYCQSSQPDLQRYCLQTGVRAENYVIKAAKGVEVFTGEAFKSVLTTNVSANNADMHIQQLIELGQRPAGDASDWLASVDNSVTKLSLFTSLRHYMNDSDNLVDMLNASGLNLPINLTEDALLSHNYLARLQSNQSLAVKLFEAENTFGRLVDYITLNLDAASASLELGVDGLAISSADSVIKSLAQTLSDSAQTERFAQLTAQTGNVKQLGNNAEFVEVLLAAIAAEVPVQMADKIRTLLGNSALSNTGSQIMQIASAYFDIAVLPKDHLTAQQMASLATLTKPISKSSNEQVLAIQSLLDVLISPDNPLSTKLAEQSEQLMSKLDKNERASLQHDLAALAQSMVDQIATNGDVQSVVATTQVTTLAQVEQGGFGFAGHHLSLSGIQDGSEYGQVIAFFSGERNASDGELIMCVAYRNPQDPSDDILGARFVGNWSQVGSNTRLSLVAEGISVQMKLLGEIDGSDIPQDAQLPQFEKLPGELYGKYNFTLNEDSALWYSDDASVSQSFGLLMSENTPSTEQACESLLSI